MNLAGKAVLVTGGTGFLGGRLVEKLALEHQARVRVLVRDFSTASRLARLPIEIVGGDVADEAVVQNSVRGCDAVFHCAHDPQLKKGLQKQKAMQGTRNVCEAVLRSGVSRMVHVSSYAVYGPTLDGDLTESAAWRPTNNAYIEAKRATEQLVIDLHREKGLPVVVVQPTIIYGPFCSPFTHRPVEDLTSGLVALVNGGEGYCNAVYVDDVVDAMVLAATQPGVLGEIFLISAATSVTWKTFYNAFEAALGIRATVDVSEEKFDQLLRERARSKSATARLVRLARDRKTVSSVKRSLPPVRYLLNLLRDRMSDDHVQFLKSRFYGKSSKVEKSEVAKPIIVPRAALPELYRARTWVRIEKARRLLGYEPKFDFLRGMELTTQYIYWANLA